MSKTFQRTGVLFVLSAPSGAGKTTLCASLRQKPDFVYAVSCTTRAPRAGEVHGEDYYFLSDEEFDTRVVAGEFLEYAEVHGRKYGTLKSTVIENLEKGIDVLLDIDTTGAASVRACDHPSIAGALADVFMMPPNIEELRLRLTNRGTETEEQINVRINNAVQEIKHWRKYKYVLISGSREQDIEKFRAIMCAERCLSRRFLPFE